MARTPDTPWGTPRSVHRTEPRTAEEARAAEARAAEEHRAEADRDRAEAHRAEAHQAPRVARYHRARPGRLVATSCTQGTGGNRAPVLLSLIHI